LQNDGKILCAGVTQDNTSGDLTVMRFETNGVLDATFGASGMVVVDVANEYELLYDLALQPDGKIVAVGITSDGNNFDIVVIRLNTDGSLDNTFSFDGMVTTSVNEDDYGQGIAVAPDGKIVVAGSTQDANLNTNTLLVRYNADGSLDNTFGTNGKLETDLSSGVDEFYNLAVTGSGKILATGGSYSGSSTDVLVARFNPDGSLDNTFSFDGVVETDFSGDTDKGWDVLIQPDSKILVGGETRDGLDKIAMARYNPDGTLDNTFGTNGKVTTQVGTNDQIYSLLIQTDGKIVGAGYSNNSGMDAMVCRYISGMNIGIGEVDAYIGSTLIYPNPITDNTVTVEYELSQPRTVSIDLFDLLGNHIAKLQTGSAEMSGSHQKTIDLPALSSGNYLMKVGSDKGSVRVMLTVVE